MQMHAGPTSGQVMLDQATSSQRVRHRGGGGGGGRAAGRPRAEQARQSVPRSRNVSRRHRHRAVVEDRQGEGGDRRVRWHAGTTRQKTSARGGARKRRDRMPYRRARRWSTEEAARPPLGGGTGTQRRTHRVARGCRTVLTIAKGSDLRRVRNTPTTSSKSEDVLKTRDELASFTIVFVKTSVRGCYNVQDAISLANARCRIASYIEAPLI